MRAIKDTALLEVVKRNSSINLSTSQICVTEEKKRGHTEEQEELQECCGDLLFNHDNQIEEESIIELNHSQITLDQDKYKWTGNHPMMSYEPDERIDTIEQRMDTLETCEILDVEETNNTLDGRNDNEETPYALAGN